jgi:hypothetical protein
VPGLIPVANVSFSHRLDLGAIRVLITSPRRGVVQDLLRRGLLVETAAKRNLAGVGGPKRIDTGRLRASITTQLVQDVGGGPVVVIGTNVKYALYVHEGTGIYGPKGRPIRPRRAKFLRFRPSRGGKYVYAKQVKGMRPNHYLTNALPAARG